MKTAYLLGKLEQEIHNEILEGLPVEENIGSRYLRMIKVCKLSKGLYGLKKSSRI